MIFLSVFERTETFKRQYRELPFKIQKKFYKVLRLFQTNFRHPSLHCKKIQGAQHGEWEGRVDRRYRFVFEWIPDGVRFLAIGPHDVIER